MSEPSISVVSVFVDHPPQATPVTKNLSEILLERPHLKVTGIRRRDAHPEQIDNALARLGRLHLEMRWSEECNAWSNRPEKGIYQRIIIFVREDKTK